MNVGISPSGVETSILRSIIGRVSHDPLGRDQNTLDNRYGPPWAALVFVGTNRYATLANKKTTGFPWCPTTPMGAIVVGVADLLMLGSDTFTTLSWNRSDAFADSGEAPLSPVGPFDSSA